MLSPDPIRAVGLLGVAAALATATVAAGERGPDASAEPAAPEAVVRVYTNADLAELPPLPVMQRAMPEADDDDWAFVQAFIESQRAKIAEERDRELERERIAIERERVRPEPRYVVPLGRLPFGPYACDGIGSLRCRAEAPVERPEPPADDDDVPSPEPPADGPRRGNPLAPSEPATARVRAGSG